MYCVDFLMHQNHMSLLLLVHNVIHPNDLNILLLANVVLNNVTLSKFCQQNFEILKYELLHFDSLQLLVQTVHCIMHLALTYYLYIHSMNSQYCFQLNVQDYC